MMLVTLRILGCASHKREELYVSSMPPLSVPPPAHNMDHVCVSFYEDVVGLLNSRRNELQALQKLSGRWSTVAKRHEKRRLVYEFTLIQDYNNNAWKYQFASTIDESFFSFSELKERNNWRYCQISSVTCYRGTPHHANKEVSESDLFSVLLPFVSSRLCCESTLDLYTKHLSQEDAARILRIFKGKAQLLDITWPNSREVNKYFLQIQVDAGGTAYVTFRL
uniref:Lipocalin n=1 Tax=Steinernema glaseri TaxID=37863 RepID=A0A1I7ZQH1_9BILA